LETDPENVSRKQLEDSHLESIAHSDFLYLVNPDGYVGESATFELGYAHGRSKPIYSSNIVGDIVLREYIANCFSPKDLVAFLKRPEINRV